MIMTRINIIGITLLACLTLGGCEQKGPATDAMLNPATQLSMPTTAEWQQFAALRIAFGHQSVGFNVLDGIAELAREQHMSLAIVETDKPFDGPAIHHFRIGRNEDPASKLSAFDSIMNSDIGASADIAMMKFCFVDFGERTDPAQLAKNYIDELDKLAQQYPNTRFVPITAPLTTVQTGPKAWLKTLTGRAPAGYAENNRRAVFNQLLRQHYADTRTLFDLAAIESLHGSSAVTIDNRSIEILDQTLTSDGGHLNTKGQLMVGMALIHHLAGLKAP
jgi:hypothetical protein